jgi:hypothetical protein
MSPEKRHFETMMVTGNAPTSYKCVYISVNKLRLLSVSLSLSRGWNEQSSNSGRRFSSFPKRPDWLWTPASLLFSGYLDSFPGVRQPGRDVDHSPPPSAEVKNERGYTSTPSCMASWRIRDIFAILPSIVYFTLNATEYLCPLCIFNSRSKMDVKIQLHAPVFLTTLAFNHKMRE